MKSILILIFTLLLGYSDAALAAATATVNRDTLSADETLTLIVSSDSPKDTDTLKLQSIEVDFEILNTSESSQFSIVNGTTKASKTWQITLAPKRAGRLTIPSLEIGSDRTNSIGVRVTRSVPMSERAGNDNIYMESELNMERAWVQQEIVYTTRIFFYPSLNRGADLAPLEIPNTIVTQLSETNYQRNVNGKNYSVYEVKYALFPQSSGLLEIPGQVFTGTLTDPRSSRSFFGRGSGGTSVRLRNVKQEILIEPRPSEFVGKQWLPARNMSLREEWSENPNGMQVGQPLTRSIIIEADGLQASQLPPLEISAPIGAQIYPDEPLSNEVTDSKGVRSTRTEKLAFIPSVDGNLTLPEISINWWNTATQKMETATLAARTFAVLPGINSNRQNIGTDTQTQQQIDNVDANPVSSSANSENNSSVANWRNFFFIALALWLFTLAAYFRKSSSTAETLADAPEVAKKETEAEAFAACKRLASEPQQLRRALIAWGKRYWPMQPVNSNTDIANLSDNQVVKEQLIALDRVIYNDSEKSVAAFDAKDLLNELEKLRANSSASTAKHSSKLEPLFHSDR